MTGVDRRSRQAPKSGRRKSPSWFCSELYSVKFFWAVEEGRAAVEEGPSGARSGTSCHVTNFKPLPLNAAHAVLKLLCEIQCTTTCSIFLPIVFLMLSCICNHNCLVLNTRHETEARNSLLWKSCAVASRQMVSFNFDDFCPLVVRKSKPLTQLINGGQIDDNELFCFLHMWRDKPEGDMWNTCLDIVKLFGKHKCCQFQQYNYNQTIYY